MSNNATVECLYKENTAELCYGITKLFRNCRNDNEKADWEKWQTMLETSGEDGDLART